MNTSNPKIFIVEDDALYSELLAHNLKLNGFENLSTFSTADDFEQHLHQMPDIVLLDYNLGDVNGVSILKKIKAFNPNIQVILLSAQDKMDVAVMALRYGAFDYQEKKADAFPKIIFLIGRICLLNEELAKEKSKFRASQKIKKIATALGVIAASIMLFSIIV